MRKNLEFAVNKDTFLALPNEVQEECKRILRAYNEVNIVFEFCKYNVSSSISIKANYAPDHKFIGVVYAEDIFTEEERMINYIESFHDYPSNYKGKRDYRMLNEIERDWSAKFKFENGDLVRA